MRQVKSVYRMIVCLLCCGGAVMAAHAQGSPEKVLSAVLGLQSFIPPDARTALTLGTERSGSAVVIDDDDLVLTIGYLVLEASTVVLYTRDGRDVEASVVAYDHATGFGLVRAREPLGLAPLRFGESAGLGVGDPVLIVGSGGPENIRPATVVDRREFAGYWEYLLDRAIFTSPPHPFFSGSALLDEDGRLVGIGSLIVSDAGPGADAVPGNMFVPIDLLKPILESLVATGRTAGPGRPWIGVYAEEHRGLVFVNRVAEDSPAMRAGLAPDDVVVKVAQTPVSSMAGFYRAMWEIGEPGVTVPLVVLRGSELVTVDVVSTDRSRWLRMSPGRLTVNALPEPRPVSMSAHRP